MKDFHFIPVEDRKNLDKLLKWVRPQGLNYPNWDSWLEKMYYETLSGYKKPWIVETNSVTIGDIIFQDHKENAWLLEIKNIRIHPEARNEGCGYFLEKKVEKVARKNNQSIICDLKSSQKDVYNFLLLRGYVQLGEKPLYDNHNPDTIMIKTFNKKTESGILYKTKESIFGKK